MGKSESCCYVKYALRIFVYTGMLLLAACSNQSADEAEDETENALRLETAVGTDTSVVIPVEEVLEVKLDDQIPANDTNLKRSSDDFEIDKVANRVYLASTGWVTVDEFWEIYLNHPEKLPQNMDHSALDAIRPDEN